MANVETIKKTIVNWHLESDSYLVREKEIREIEVTRTTFVSKNGKNKVEKSEKILSSNFETIKKIPVRLVTSKEIDSLRKLDIPGFIYKEGEKLFYAELTKELKESLTHVFKESHKCGESCKYMSAAPVEKGGCPKVINKATYIEKYPWISLGFEVFNSTNEALYVARCSNYEMCKPRVNNTSMAERRERSKALEEFLYN